MTWIKGQSGNPGGKVQRPDIRLLCQRGSKRAVALLRQAVEGKLDCSPADRLKAAMDKQWTDNGNITGQPKPAH